MPLECELASSRSPGTFALGFVTLGSRLVDSRILGSKVREICWKTNTRHNQLHDRIDLNLGKEFRGLLRQIDSRYTSHTSA